MVVLIPSDQVRVFIDDTFAEILVGFGQNDPESLVRTSDIFQFLESHRADALRSIDEHERKKSAADSLRG